MFGGIRGAFSRFIAGDGLFLAAGLAFFFLVSLIPLTLIGVSIVGFALSSEQAARGVVGPLTRDLPVLTNPISRGPPRVRAGGEAPGGGGAPRVRAFCAPPLERGPPRHAPHARHPQRTELRAEYRRRCRHGAPARCLPVRADGDDVGTPVDPRVG